MAPSPAALDPGSGDLPLSSDPVTFTTLEGDGDELMPLAGDVPLARFDFFNCMRPWSMYALLPDLSELAAAASPLSIAPSLVVVAARSLSDIVSCYGSACLFDIDCLLLREVKSKNFLNKIN